MEELWKAIVGFTGYQISNLGKVYSQKSKKVLKTYTINSGYEAVSLRLNGKSHKVLVHRLVARAFCEGFEEGKLVNHKDTNRLHNEASNLEWMTYVESIQEMKDRDALNTHTARAANLKNQLKKVDMYSADGETLIKTFDSIKQAAEESGTRKEHISRVVRGQRFRAGGYHWKYHNPADNYAYYRKGMRS